MVALRHGRAGLRPLWHHGFGGIGQADADELRVSPSGERVAVLARDKALRLLAAKDGKVLQEGKQSPRDVAWDADALGWIVSHVNIVGEAVPAHEVRYVIPGYEVRAEWGSGKATSDRTTIGVKYAKEEPKTELVVVPLQTANFVLKAGVPDTRVDAELTINTDVTLWSADPFSIYARAERVWIDGGIAYDRGDPRYQPKSDFELGLEGAR